MVTPRHRAHGDTDDSEQLDGTWHVGRSMPGMFPVDEQTCPCPKAPCGLAAPTADIDCPAHTGNLPIYQKHAAATCSGRNPWWKRLRSTRP